MATNHVIDLNTTEGMREYVKTFSDADLRTLAESKSISHIVIGLVAQVELDNRHATNQEG